MHVAKTIYKCSIMVSTYLLQGMNLNALISVYIQRYVTTYLICIFIKILAKDQETLIEQSFRYWVSIIKVCEVGFFQNCSKSGNPLIFHHFLCF